MAKQLRVAPDLALPLEVVTSTNALLAKRGSGKTYTASVLAEEMLEANLPVVVIDPTGAWWGLRSSADGKSTGYPVVVFGGEHADVALAEGSGADVARFIVEQRPPGVILDLSLMRKAEAVRFMLPFIETLYHRNREPLHLFWDECDLHIPQKPFADQARLLGAAEDLVRRGRVKGLGVTLITQRPAVVNKDVLTQTETLIVMRMVGPQDVEAVRAWVKQHDLEGVAPEMLASLPSLPVGDSWWWSPGFLEIFQHTRVRERHTFDSSRTPKVGEKIKPPKVLAPIDIERLRERFAASIEEAKATDPKTLKRTVDQLHHALKMASAEVDRLKASNGKGKPQPADKAIIYNAIDAARAALAKSVTKLVTPVEKHLDRLANTAVRNIPEWTTEAFTMVGAINTLLAAATAPGESFPGRITLVSHRGVTPHPANVRVRTPLVEREKPIPTSNDGALSSGKLAILNAIAELNALGLDTPTVEQIALLRGVSHTTGTFKQDMRDLVDISHIAKVAPGRYTLMPIGAEIASAAGAPRTLSELHERWLATVDRQSKARGDILRYVIDQNSATITAERLAKDLGKSHTTGTFKQDVRTLSKLNLISRERGVIEATDVLFPPGL